jgi:hypothetical protein
MVSERGTALILPIRRRRHRLIRGACLVDIGRMTAQPDSRRIAVGFLIGVPVSLLFLWLAFRGTDRAAVADAIRTARPGPLLAGAATLWGTYVLQSIRWRLIAGTDAVPLTRFLGMVVGGVSVNNVVPGRIGELLRARWLSVDARLAYGRSLATVVLDRLGDVVALALLFAASVWAIGNAPWLHRFALGATIAAAVAILVVVVARLYVRARARGRRRRGRLRSLARDTIDGLAVRLGRRMWLVIVALSVAVWLVFALAALLIARSVGIELSALDVLFLASVVNLGVAIPSSPGFVGTYQWLVVESLAVLGHPAREKALAMSILLHAAWYVPTTIAGGTFIVLRARSLPSRRAPRAASLEPEPASGHDAPGRAGIPGPPG